MSDDEDKSVFYEVCMQGENGGGLCGPFGGCSGRKGGPVTPERAKEIAEKLGREMFGERAVVREGNPDHLGSWGFGRGSAGEGWRTFEHAKVGDTKVELSFGEHPHSRRDASIYARFPDGLIVGFDGHRAALSINVEETNRLKESHLSGDQVRGSAVGTVHAGGLLVLRVTARDAKEAMAEIISKIQRVMEHSVALWRADERKKLVGRKVYWRGEPAVIERFDEEMLEVTLRAETESGTFRRMPWHEDDDEQRTLHDSVYSEGIWWWREEKRSKRS